MKEAVVRNAADKKQVKEAKRKEDNKRDEQLADLKAVMETPQGRRLMWRILGYCNTFGSVWEPSAKIHYKAGQQDVGHFILAEITRANEELLFNMMRENKKGKME